ncbi:MAG: fumarylacetoacetate hydrolase family protein [Gammaproteobacteria bacterium]|nr:fumarylacetoacetate hydrolase family protein [Gammaproteobacteria bacterium]
MKLLTFTTNHSSQQKLGAHLDGNNVVDLVRAYEVCFDAAAPDWFDSVSKLLQGGDRAMQLAAETFDRAGSKSRDDGSVILDMNEITFHPPAGDRAKILCVTMNYSSHAQASGSKQSEEPYFFIKMPTTMTAHGQPICHSKTSQKHDSEIELAVIIGKRGKYITREDAFDHIAGYAVINDFSFRDRRSLTDDPNSARLHWFTLKNLDNATPIGPWLVTKDEIPDPYDLQIILTLDNEPGLKQSGSTEGMMHRIEDLVMYASNGLTLEPGDVIATGTPHEVAFGQQRWLQDGDILRAEISKIGALVNPIKSEV